MDYYSDLILMCKNKTQAKSIIKKIYKNGWVDATNKMIRSSIKNLGEWNEEDKEEFYDLNNG